MVWERERLPCHSTLSSASQAAPSSSLPFQSQTTQPGSEPPPILPQPLRHFPKGLWCWNKQETSLALKGVGKASSEAPFLWVPLDSLRKDRSSLGTKGSVRATGIFGEIQGQKLPLPAFQGPPSSRTAQSLLLRAPLGLSTAQQQEKAGREAGRGYGCSWARSGFSWRGPSSVWNSACRTVFTIILQVEPLLFGSNPPFSHSLLILDFQKPDLD